MAVEARHLNLFPSQQLLYNNSEIMNPVQANGGGIYSTQTYGVPMMTGGLVSTEALLPAYNMMNDSMLPKTTPCAAAMQSDSGLTYNVPLSTTLSRKRSRVESVNPNPNLFSYPTAPASHHYKTNNNSFSFLGEDISLQIQQQQFDVDRLISQHMEKVRVEIEEKRKRQARRIIESIEMGMMKRLRAKEVEIEKIGNMNWTLEEKVKSLCIENQIWRDLAQTNEATANALRTNLEQVLAQVEDEPNNNQNDAVAAALMDDAQSCCDSSGDDVDVVGWRAVKGAAEEGSSGGPGKSGGESRWCRNCGKEESCVLLLPCRHLCLCTVCGSSLHTCPVCKSTKNASVHVNMS